ncbi:unnamed protein product [Dicrocoelium dendriticum]|nr:unnamed protein product [Dicrocoelium dendriticum]
MNMAVSLNTETDGPMGSSFDESTAACGQVNCSEPVTDASGGMQCDVCCRWYHESCTGLQADQYQMLSSSVHFLFSCAECCAKRSTRPAVTGAKLSALASRLADVELAIAKLASIASLDTKMDLILKSLNISFEDTAIAGNIADDPSTGVSHSIIKSHILPANPGSIAGGPHDPIKVKKNRVRKYQKPSAKPREIVATASNEMPSLTVVKSSEDCTQNFPQTLTVSAASEPACSDEMLVTAQCDTKSTAPAPVSQKKKRTRSARKTSKGLEDPGTSKTPAIERKTYATVASASFGKPATVPPPVVKTAGIGVESKARGVNTPRRADSFTDSSVIFRNVTESEAVLPRERILDDIKWLKLCVSKLLPPGFPGVTVRKLTRLGNVPIATPNPRPRLLRVVLSTPEERKSLLRFAFKLKGSGVSVQPDLPLADRLKLKEAIKDLKTRRAAGEQGLRLVGFQVVSRKLLSALSEPILMAHDPGMVVPTSLR